MAIHQIQLTCHIENRHQTLPVGCSTSPSPMGAASDIRTDIIQCRVDKQYLDEKLALQQVLEIRGRLTYEQAI